MYAHLYTHTSSRPQKCSICSEFKNFDFGIAAYIDKYSYGLNCWHNDHALVLDLSYRLKNYFNRYMLQYYFA